MRDSYYKQPILDLLQRSTTVTTVSLRKITHRFSEYIRQLRVQGHLIETNRVMQKNGKWNCWYEYKGMITNV